MVFRLLRPPAPLGFLLLGGQPHTAELADAESQRRSIVAVCQPVEQ